MQVFYHALHVAVIVAVAGIGKRMEPGVFGNFFDEAAKGFGIFPNFFQIRLPGFFVGQGWQHKAEFIFAFEFIFEEYFLQHANVVGGVGGEGGNGIKGVDVKQGLLTVNILQHGFVIGGGPVSVEDDFVKLFRDLFREGMWRVQGFMFNVYSSWFIVQGLKFGIFGVFSKWFDGDVMVVGHSLLFVLFGRLPSEAEKPVNHSLCFLLPRGRAIGYSLGLCCNACVLRWLRSSASSLQRHWCSPGRGLPPLSLARIKGC